jgi:protoporphyrin/coproporphyrin ferrochelatase
MPSYDAFLLLSFGGPDGPDDVLPFLENVTRGRGVPAQRLAEVAEHYYAVGGVSPINAQCREMLASIADAFQKEGIDLPLYWGNRNWDPFLADTVRQLKADGARRVIAFATSAYSSYSACRQYLDDIERAVAVVQGEGVQAAGVQAAGAGDGAPRIDKIRPYYARAGFIEPFAASVESALGELPDGAQDGARLVFTAHSVPLGMAASSGSVRAGTAVPGTAGGKYAAELRQASRMITERVRGGTHPFDLVFQSRSGPPSVPWLEPDVNEHLAALAKGMLANGEPLPEGAPSGVVVVPVGFVSDHMEVVHDLDVEAAQTAATLGLPFARAKAPGLTPEFAAMVAELVAERIASADTPDGADFCPADCCRYAPSRPGRPAGPPSSGAQA